MSLPHSNRCVARPLPDPEGDEYIEVRRSLVHGRGLFAARDLPKGTRIMEYRGEKVPRAEGDRRAEKQWKKGRIYVFRLNQRYDLDGSPRWNKSRLANFSCAPNAESENERGRCIWIVATRNIKAGEEITFDYHLEMQEPPPECRCGAQNCIGYMVGEGERDKLRAWLEANGRPVPDALQA